MRLLSHDHDFFQQFSPSIAAATYTSTSSEYTQLQWQSRRSQMDLSRLPPTISPPPNGGLAEQYDKSTVCPLSAADLTWSYASVLTARASRVQASKLGCKRFDCTHDLRPKPGATGLSLSMSKRLRNVCTLINHFAISTSISREHILVLLMRYKIGHRLRPAIGCKLPDIEQYVLVLVLDHMCTFVDLTRRTVTVNLPPNTISNTNISESSMVRLRGDPNNSVTTPAKLSTIRGDE